MELARRVAEWRKAAGFHARRHGGYFTSPVHIVATVHKTRGGRWDAGNLYPTAKAVVDGLVDAGVIFDDSNEYVVGPDLRAGEKRAAACVVLSVNVIEEAS
jgi:hypothetical protein